ncbi:MAG TPA: hypothetical protein VGS08_00955 [Candidatus Saccharimonadales bacterium]|nr:hypothetical protein [Candidatus Saccharimonadales bacterium]
MRGRLLLGTIIGLATLGVTVAASTHTALACGGRALAYGRAQFCGYFDDQGDNMGGNVLSPPGFPNRVRDATSFINFIKGDLSGGGQDKTGAEFIIFTMLGYNGGSNQIPASRVPTTAQLNQWEAEVNAFDTASPRPGVTTGPSGLVEWDVTGTLACGDINSYKQGGHNDDAFYTETRSSLPPCPENGVEFIKFWDTNHHLLYELKRDCGNPIGDSSGLPPPPIVSYNLIPIVDVTVAGVANATSAEVGDKIIFSYSIENTQNTTTAESCLNFDPNPKSHTGVFPTPPPNSPGDDVGTNSFICGDSSGKLPGRSTTSVGTPTNYTVKSSDVNSTICDSLSIPQPTPQPGSPPAIVEVCVTVAAKPYFKVFGGDISAGNGLVDTTTNSCSLNTTASITSWNQGPSNYNGAGSEFAAYATGALNLFSSGQPSSAPDSLSFGNVSADESGGTYGGGYAKTPPMPCIPDYYTATPQGGQPLPQSPPSSGTTALSGLNGIYTYDATTNPNPLEIVEIAGSSITIGSGTTIQLYVNGNVYIKNNITYNGSWTPGQIPLFELIVSGNIYIDPAVTQLDGIYIAQRNNLTAGDCGTGDSGCIATCATAIGPPTLPDATLYNTCNSHSQLTIKGSFVANRVELLRTYGTLSNAPGDHVPGSPTSDGAEQFNYNPSLWIAQPNQQVSLNEYNAVVSLPPVL